MDPTVTGWNTDPAQRHLGADPLIGRLRSSRRHLAWVGGMVTAWAAVLFTLILRYAPDCDHRHGDPINAPLRPAYADAMANNMRKERWLYVRWGKVIFLPFIDMNCTAGTRRFAPPDARDFQSNEWRHAFIIATGFPAPAAVERLALRWETGRGEWLPRDRHGYLSQRALHRLPTCALKRAALTTAGDLPAEPP